MDRQINYFIVIMLLFYPFKESSMILPYESCTVGNIYIYINTNIYIYHTPYFVLLAISPSFRGIEDTKNALVS